MSQTSAPAGKVSEVLRQLPQDPSLAIVFPGQGSQKAGMGNDARAASEMARRIYATADETLGFALSTLCAEGPDDELTTTENAQPAILATSIASLAASIETGEVNRSPAFVAGHSLGEYSALVAAGSLGFEDALRMVRERGRLMGAVKSGTLAAIVGLDEETVLGICKDSGAEVANFNAPTQTVVGGTPEATEEACRLAKERGGRGIPVKVSGAFHTSLMAPAADAFSQIVEEAPIEDPQITIVGNVSSRPLARAADVREDLTSQIRSPVRWYQSVDLMAHGGVTRVMEIGPGQILTNQLKRSHPALQYYPWDEPGK